MKGRQWGFLRFNVRSYVLCCIVPFHAPPARGNYPLTASSEPHTLSNGGLVEAKIPFEIPIHDRRVRVEADRQTAFQHLVYVMDMLQFEGLRNVGFKSRE
jgi:hypothetical protein